MTAVCLASSLQPTESSSAGAANVEVALEHSLQIRSLSFDFCYSVISIFCDKFVNDIDIDPDQVIG